MWSLHDTCQTRINVEGTRNVVDAALAAGVRRLVHSRSRYARCRAGCSAWRRGPAWRWRQVTGGEPEATPEGVTMACARARAVSLAEQELGYRPASLQTMVEDCYL